MTREEFRKQMRPCRACGELCDGDVCDQSCADLLDVDYELYEDDPEIAENEDK